MIWHIAPITISSKLDHLRRKTPKRYFKNITKVGERASSEVEVEFVSVRTVSSLGDRLVAFEVILRTVVDGVGQLEPAVQGAGGPCDGAATVEPPRLVQHHLRGLSLPDLLPAWTRRLGSLLGSVALLQTVGVQLENVGRSWNDADALEAVRDVLIASGRGWEDHVTAESPVAVAPRRDGVEQDGDRRVRDFARRHRLRQELPLELEREVAAGEAWKTIGITMRMN